MRKEGTGKTIKERDLIMKREEGGGGGEELKKKEGLKDVDGS